MFTCTEDLKWVVDLNNEGLIVVKEGGRIIAWAHAEEDTLIGKQLILAFNDLVKEHNKDD